MRLPTLTSTITADGTCTTLVGSEVVGVSHVAPAEVSLPAWPWTNPLTAAESSSTVVASTGGHAHGPEETAGLV